MGSGLVDGIAADSQGNVHLAFEADNVVMRQDSLGTLTRMAGTGTFGYSGDDCPAANAQLNFPSSVAVDSTGNLYIAESSNNRISRLTGEVMSTVAGNGI